MNKILVMGLGVSGRESASFLKKRGFSVVLHDDNKSHLSSVAKEMNLSSFSDGDSLNFSFAVVSPGIPETHPLFVQLTQEGVEIIGDIELAARNFPPSSRLVAITGTNGKSTTVTLIRDLLLSLDYSVFLCGNIGQPMISGVDDGYDIFVVELSSFQLDLLFSLPITVAAVLNLTNDHLDRYDGFDDYVLSKMHIFDLLSSDGRAIYNTDFIAEHKMSFSGEIRSFSAEEAGDDAQLSGGVVTAGNAFGSVKQTALSQPHNVENVKAAFLAVDYFLSKPRDFTAVLEQFAPLKHRMELVAQFSGVTFYDDSKGTNPGASERALAGFSDKTVVLLLGGVDKGGSYAELRSLADEKCKGVVVFGEATPAIMSYFEGFKPLAKVESMKEAVSVGHNLAGSDGVVLLSPACSSFDWYKNYKDRGDDFVKHVALLEGGQRDD